MQTQTFNTICMIKFVSLAWTSWNSRFRYTADIYYLALPLKYLICPHYWSPLPISTPFSILPITLNSHSFLPDVQTKISLTYPLLFPSLIFTSTLSANTLSSTFRIYPRSDHLWPPLLSSCFKAVIVSHYPNGPPNGPLRVYPCSLHSGHKTAPQLSLYT